MKKVFSFSFILYLVLIIGCTSVPFQLENTPKDDKAFLLPPSVLKKKYSDIVGLYPPNIQSYIEQKKTEDSVPNYRYPIKEDLIDVLGIPESVVVVEENPTIIFSGVLSKFGVASVELPPLSLLYFGLAGIGYTTSKPEEVITWRKGHYEIQARNTFNLTQISSWEWYYKPNISTNESIYKYRLKDSYFISSVSHPLHSTREKDLLERNFISGGAGKNFYKGRYYDVARFEAFLSLHAFTDEKFHILNISQQQVNLVFSKNINKYEFGLGIWYDTSLYDYFDNGYKGKIGAFSEFVFLKTETTNHALRLGFSRFFQDHFSQQTFGRLQIVSRFHGFQ